MTRWMIVFACLSCVVVVVVVQSVPVDVILPPEEFAQHPVLSSAYHKCLDLMDDEWCLPEFRPKKCAKTHWHSINAQFEGDHCMSVRDRGVLKEEIPPPLYAPQQQQQQYIIAHDEGHDDIVIYPAGVADAEDEAVIEAAVGEFISLNMGHNYAMRCFPPQITPKTSTPLTIPTCCTAKTLNTSTWSTCKVA